MSGSQPSPAKRDRPSRHREIILLLAPFVVVWVVYLSLRASMPEDALAPFRNDLYWPDASLTLLAKQPGIVFKVVVHVAITLALGTLLGMLMIGLGWLVEKLGGPRFEQHGFVAYPLAFVLVFAFLLVPERITRVDPERQVISVRAVLPMPPFTSWPQEVPIADVRALGTRLGWGGGKDKVRVVEILAMRREGEPVLLGETECPGADGECLAWADPAAVALLGWLGHGEAPRITASKDGSVRIYERVSPGH